MYTDRLLPHDIEAEESLIGSILIDSESITKISHFLKTEDIYSEKIKWCFQACLSLLERMEGINQVSLAHELSLQDKLENIGGIDYLNNLVNIVPTSVHIEEYARIIHRTSIMRRIVQAGSEITNIGFSSLSDTDQALSEAEESIYKIRTDRASRDFEHIREVLDAYLQESSAMQDNTSDRLAPISTGFIDIDKLIGGGLQRSDMVVLAARPSLGKSSLVFNIAKHAAMNGSSVGIFSLEMSNEQIVLRLLSTESDVDTHRLRVGLINENEERRILDAIGGLSDLPIYIDDTPIQNIMEIRSKAKRLQAEHGLDLVIVDYLQLLSGTSNGWRSENRVQEMGEISRSLKGVARDLDIPVLACSQLSRAVEQRPNHRPILSDLRESGSIEQDADIVAFIYREDHYTTREEWESKNPTKPYPENIAEIIVAKHRNGPLATIPLYFRGSLVRFENLTSENSKT